MAPTWPSPTPTWHSNTYPSISPTRLELSAKGKNVLVTGGGTGIGAETARSFAKAGASRIALLGRREQPLVETKESIESQFPGTQVFVAPTDVTDKDQVDAAFARFLGSDRKLDVLISGAAFGGPVESLTHVDNDKFLNAVSVNIQSALYISKAFLQYASPDAVAIEINSNAAHVNFVPAFSAYSVAKLAVYRLWDTLALAEPGLRVYHVHPGVVDTDMNREAGGVEALGYEDHVSLPADFHVWLASPEASFLKGKYLWVNWDVDELKARSSEIEGSTELNVQVVGWPFGNPGWMASLGKVDFQPTS